MPEENRKMLAFILLDGKIRPCCPGCALRLEEVGMLKRFLTDEGVDDVALLLGFSLVEPHTIEDCRALIAQGEHQH